MNVNLHKLSKFALNFFDRLMNSSFVKYCTFLGIVSLVIYSCAKISAPTGGPKDITPPKVLESTPAMNSTKFEGQKIEITFDKFVQLKDLNKSLVVSPPMKKKPEVVIRGKSVVILLQEDLKPNTTYRFYFGDAIVDLHESNPYRNFDLVFSTGDYVDSLTLRGRVINAFDNKPDKDGLYVMLYSKFQDSIPRKQLPDYISKANEEGWFTLSHVRSDSFMIFALKDLNQNYLFDQPSEAIAFSDTLIHLNTRYFLPNDSLNKVDTTRSDSLRKLRPPFKPQIVLNSFVETHEKQYLKKHERTLPEKIDIVFNRHLYDSLKFTPLNFEKENWLIVDKTIKSDTMTYWISDTSVVHRDTLKLKITYDIKDSSEHLIPKSDTISLVYKKPGLGKGRREASKVKVNNFKITSSTDSKPAVDLNGKVFLMASYPVLSFDVSKMTLLKIEEAKKIPVKFTITHDKASLRRYFVNFKIEPNYDYILTVDSASFTSIYQQVSDSTSFKFKTEKDDYYGTIKLTLSNVKEQMIIQLLDEKENLVTQKIVDKGQLIIFDYLTPATYKIKANYDRNSNKIWDTGNFAKKLQPEKVLYYNKKISVRSNWDIEESWELE